MSKNFEVKVFGFKEFEKALKRNPTVVKREVKKFLVRGLSEYRRGIKNNPWRIGGSGGGVPVKTYGLMDAHITEYRGMSGRIYVRKASSRGSNGRAITTDKYGFYVHEGTKNMKARPWLDFTFDKKDRTITKLQTNLLESIVKDLAK